MIDIAPSTFARAVFLSLSFGLSSMLIAWSWFRLDWWALVNVGVAVATIALLFCVNVMDKQRARFIAFSKPTPTEQEAVHVFVESVNRLAPYLRNHFSPYDVTDSWEDLGDQAREHWRQEAAAVLRLIAAPPNG